MKEIKKEEVKEENNNKAKEQKKKSKKIDIKILAYIFTILLVLIVILIATNKEGSHSTKIKSTLDDMVKKSEIQTATFTYNVIAKKCKNEKKCNKDSNNIDDFEYVVSCKGTITAGIEVKNIKIKLDEENKKLTITVPEAKLNDKNILSRTFLNGEDLDADKLPEATKLCEDTLSEKVEKDEKLLPAAKEQAKVVLKSYYEQWLKALGEDYTIEMK